MNQQVELEPVAESHAPVIQKLAASHPDIVKYTRLPDPYPENCAEKWIQYAGPRHQNDDEYSFVVKNQRDQIVGTCGLIVNKEENEAELGYWIGHKFWNHGYATAAIQEALNFAFRNKSFDRVFALPLKRNAASCIVLEKNGLRHIDTRQNTNPKWKETDKIAVYAITYQEWENNSTKPEH